MKDHIGNILVVGDNVAFCQGMNTTLNILRYGTIIGFTDQRAKVKKTKDEKIGDFAPHNLIKVYTPS